MALDNSRVVPTDSIMLVRLSAEQKTYAQTHGLDLECGRDPHVAEMRYEEYMNLLQNLSEQWSFAGATMDSSGPTIYDLTGLEKKVFPQIAISTEHYSALSSIGFPPQRTVLVTARETTGEYSRGDKIYVRDLLTEDRVLCSVLAVLPPSGVGKDQRVQVAPLEYPDIRHALGHHSLPRISSGEEL